MNFLPAIDILDGNVVRLAQGDYERVTVYNDDPAYQAQLFEEAGSQWLHVVDLNGAKTGVPTNTDAIRAILERTSLKVEVGGGIRSLEAIEAMANLGVSRIVLGTALVEDEALCRKALEIYGDMLVCGIDGRHGSVAVHGWLDTSDETPKGLARRMGEAGFSHLVFTDITRDGMKSGIDPAAYLAIAAAFGHSVIASGGVGTLADLAKLACAGDAIEGVIVGRALYEKTLSVEEGCAFCAGTLTYQVMDSMTAPISLDQL